MVSLVAETDCNDENRPLTKNRTRRSEVSFSVEKFDMDTDTPMTEVKTYPVQMNAFDSLTELIKEMSADNPEIAKEMKKKGRYGSFESVLDYKSRNFLLERLSKGYASDEGWSYYKNAKAKVFANPEHVAKLGNIGLDTRRKRRSDIAGCIVNIDKAMTGLNPMETFKRNNSQKSVRVFIDYAQSCSVDAERIIDTATKAVAICEVLEKKGYATEITFGNTSMFSKFNLKNHHFSDKSSEKSVIGVTKFIAKRAGEPINESKLVNYCSSGIFRDLLFNYWKGCLGITGGLGRPLYAEVRPSENVQEMKKLVDADVYVGKEDHFSDILSNVVGAVQ